ncbi:MAG: hypothetical protein ACI3VS_03525 [Evtepia sp.]
MLMIPPYTFPDPNPGPDPQSLTYPDRIHRMKKHQEQEDLWERGRLHYEAGQTDIYREFMALSDWYASMTGYRGELFSLRELSLHRGKILVTCQRAGKAPRKFFLTPETLKEDLIQRKIPYWEQAAEQYLAGLHRLMVAANQTPWIKQLRQLVQTGNQNAAQFFQSPQFQVDFFDGHLIALAPPELSSPNPITDNMFPFFHQYFGLTKAQCRNLFSALKQEINVRRSADLACHPCQPLRSLRTADLVYSDEQGAYVVGRSKDSRSLSLIGAASVGYSHTQKMLPLPAPVRLRNQPDSFLSSLFAFTGGREEGIDSLAELAASIAAPTPGRHQLSVVFTRHNQSSIRSFLFQLFLWRTIYKVSPERTDPTHSISNLLKKRNLKDLLFAQVRGSFLLLLTDNLPTPSQDADFRAMIQGGRIAVPDSLVSNLSFHNQMHLVYVTGSEKLANTLVQRYQAKLVDLSPWEQPWTGPELSRIEVTWLQRNLLPHGCLCKRHLKPKRAAKKADAFPPAFADQELLDFLAHQCRVSPELRCSREELYAAYAAFHTRLHGTALTETPICFGKRVRRQLPSGVEYKVARHGAEKKTLFCYVGLGIRSQPYTPPSSAPKKEGTDTLADFRAYLEKMEPMADRLFPSLPDFNPRLVGPHHP